MGLDAEPINWNEFYNAYTGLKFSIHKKDDCRVFVPTYTNAFCSLTAETSAQGTEMTFKDEWSSQSFIIDGSTEKIDNVLLKQLWQYASSNILWDDYKKQLSFQDIDVEEITLYDFVKNIDSFMVIHKLSKFGDVWWSKRVSTDTVNENTRYENVSISIATSSNQMVEFWSADKWINDEYKKYISNTSSYSGFFTSTDFINGGWFTAPDLVISTKPFEKLKIADVLLNLNFTFDPSYFGHYYTVNSRIGARIKDETSTTVLDESQSKNSQNDNIYASTLTSHWVGGLVNTNNIGTVGEIGSYVDDSCQVKSDAIEYTESTSNPLEISHKISGQLSLNPDYDIEKRDFLGTIDPINWKSAEAENNAHGIGVLNQSRAFGRASGTRDNGVVVGGISTDSNNSKKTEILSTAEIWQNDGFLKNIQISLNTPRCFHVQGGVGGSSCVVIGGYSDFNTDNNKEFSEYSKSGVLNNAEIFIRGDDASLSYFKTISNVQLNVSRGDHAGYLAANTQSRQDKFEVPELIKNYALTENDEQTILDFIKAKSENLLNTDNTVRYAVSNITGFVYGGSTTGKSNLISTATESELSATYEKINTTNIISSENSGTTSILIADTVQSVIKDVLTIDGSSTDGSTVNLPSCGKYRIEYIDGGFDVGTGRIIKDVLTVNTGNSDGVKVDLSDSGKYRLTYLSSMENIECQEKIVDALAIPGWEDMGVELEMPYAGKYRIKYIEGDVDDPGTGGTTPEQISSLTFIGSSSAGTSYSVTKCGKYRITYDSGYFTTKPSPVTYAASFKLYVNNVLVDTVWNTDFTNLTDLYDYMDISPFNTPLLSRKRYHEFCVNDATMASPETIKLVANDPTDGGLTDNSGSVVVALSYMGRDSCTCTTILEPVDVMLNDNYNSLAFVSEDTHYIDVADPKSVMRLRYHDLSNNWADNNQSYGSIVVEVCYMGTSNITAAAEVGVYVNDITAGTFTLVPNINYEFCSPFDKSELRVVGTNGIQSVANFRLDYLGATVDCSGNTTLSSLVSTTSGGLYGSQLDLYINEQIVDVILNATSPTKSDLEFYLQSRPSSRKYDFCSAEPNSVIRLKNPYGSSGFENVKVLYLGESDCDCSSVIESQTSTTTVSENEVTVSYVSVDSSLEYPVRCHGMVYVGDETSGISTGGRCELNNISGVITRLYEKYREGYSHVVDDTIRSELEKDRILDLVYELKDGTWIRRQNMLESVYWHCGVGDSSHALFWGGIHNSVGSVRVEVLNTNPDINQISVSDFLCTDTTKDFAQNTITYAGKDYTDVLSGISSCWVSPSWESYTDSDLFNDPRYRNDQETIQYSYDTNYPTFTLSTVLPSNPAPIAPQDDDMVSIDHTLGTTTIGITKTLTTGGTFRVQATVSGTSNTTNGTFGIESTSLRIESGTSAVYPSDIATITNVSKSFEFSDVEIKSNGNVEVNYSLSESFTYTTNSNPTAQEYEFGGVGVLTFPSLTAIYDSIKAGLTLSATSHTFRLLKNSFILDLPFAMTGSVGGIKFEMSDDNGIMVGVVTSDQLWGAELTDCGPDISNIIQLTADFSPVTNQKWGVPLWTQLLLEDTGSFNLGYSFDRKEEITDTRSGSIAHESTVVTISANSIGSILSERLLISGSTIKQNHTYIAMNNISLSAVNDLCETVAPSSTLTVSFSGQSRDNEYTEWASSFIQEYQSDKRFSAPMKWVESNGIGLTPSREQSSYDIAWNRYMDGVGLGGEVPDYDTIYNTTTEKLRNPNEWREMNTWFVGQMAFGSVNAAVVVGGHKVTSDVGETGRGMGYHAKDTTPRTFVWDITTIPEEDSYSKNYLGRRLFNFYKQQNETVSTSIDSVSSLNLVIFNAESDIVNEREGTVLFDGVATQTVKFDSALPDASYSISLTPSENIKAWWTDKTVNGFTINVETSSFNGYVDYLATSVSKVTETDINNNEPLDGYDFNK